MHSLDDDFYLGRNLLENKLVSREALLECLFQTAQDRRSGAQRGYAKPLGVLLVERGLMSEEEVNRILAAQVSKAGEPRNVSEAEVGKLLVAAGIMLKEEVEDCIRLQQQMRDAGKAPLRLGELVVSRGYATGQQVMRVLAYQKRLLFACDGCGARVGAPAPPPGNHYRCRKCGGIMAPLGSAAAGMPHGGSAMHEAAQGAEEQIEVDRVLGGHLWENGIARPDQIRGCQHLQNEFARYGLVVPLLELLRRQGVISWKQQHEIGSMDFTKVVPEGDWRRQTVPGYVLRTRVCGLERSSIYSSDPAAGGEKVGLKILHRELARDEGSLQRFRREAELMLRLTHPRLLRGRQYGTANGRPYLVTDPVEGRTLAQAVSDSGVFAVRAALSIVRQVAEGLAYLHGDGVVHRDLRADHVVLDGSNHAKVCDFSSSAMLGGPAPADGDGRIADDIYALGLLLYALLTGHESVTMPGQAVADQMETLLPVPNLMVLQTSPDVVRLIKQMTAENRARRLKSAGEVVASIDRISSQ